MKDYKMTPDELENIPERVSYDDISPYLFDGAKTARQPWTNAFGKGSIKKRRNTRNKTPMIKDKSKPDEKKKIELIPCFWP